VGGAVTLLCRRRRCGFLATRPVFSFGGDVIAMRCSSNHITPTGDKQPPRCKECSCRNGHATGCPNLLADAWEQATQHAEDGDLEESAMWVEQMIINGYFVGIFSRRVRILGDVDG
jgi:hypothetical protein